MSQSTIFAVLGGMADPPEATNLDEVIGLVGSHLAHQVDLTDQGWRRLWVEIGSFVQFLQVREIQGLASVNPATALEFIDRPYPARTDGWCDPAVATMRTRRGAIRLLYGTGRFLGLVEGDPTIDIHFPTSPLSDTRPLTDDEVYLGRTWSRLTLVTNRDAAAWAIAEASATNSELAAIRRCDVDLDNGTVWLHGNEKWREPRTAKLSDWGIEAISQRLNEIDDLDAERLILTDATSNRNCKQSSTNQPIAATMRHAGLRADPMVKPVSLSLSAGRRVLEETGQIDLAARALGMRNLGRAAHWLRFDW